MAYDFNGTDQWYEASAAALSNTLTFTLACWFDSDSITATQPLISLDSNDGNHAARLIANGATSGDPVQFNYRDNGSNYTANSTAGFTAGTWFHAAAVSYSATLRRAFINGGNAGSNTTTRTARAYNRTTIGANWNGSAYGSKMDGRIAEVGIWNIALTNAEISALARGVRPSLIRPANLVLYVPLVREVHDLSKGLSFSDAGSPAVADHPRRIA